MAYSMTQKVFSGERLIFGSLHQTASNQASGIGFSLPPTETTLLARTCSIAGMPINGMRQYSIKEENEVFHLLTRQ